MRISVAEIKFAPKEIFYQILEWAVMPTFDLVIEYGDEGIILLKRTIAPYQAQWALPGLRMYKGEEIEDTLLRIASQELGLKIELSKRIFLGQYVGKFATEQNRQDLSTAFHIRIRSDQKIKFNEKHFSSMKMIKSKGDIPLKTGASYKFYLNRYFDLKEDSRYLPLDLYRQIHEQVPIPGVDIILKTLDGGFLLVQRQTEPAKGQWWLVGGRVYKNELLEQAARRKVQEEIGLKLPPGSLHQVRGSYETIFTADPFGHGKGTHTINSCFVAELTTEDLAAIQLDRYHPQFQVFPRVEKEWHPYLKEVLKDVGIVRPE